MNTKRSVFVGFRKNPHASSVTSLLQPMEIKKYNDLRVHEMCGTHTGEKLYGFADDVYLLLMQKNYDKINNLEYQSFLKDLSLSVGTVTSKTKPKMSDDQLFSYIKSRHVQSASELSSWFDYLSGQYDLTKENYDNTIKRLREEREQQQQQSQTVVQGTASDT